MLGIATEGTAPGSRPEGVTECITDHHTGDLSTLWVNLV
jgi:hypothetical protein